MVRRSLWVLALSGCLWGADGDKAADTASATGGTAGPGGTATWSATGGTATGGTATGGTGGTATGGTATGGSGGTATGGTATGGTGTGGTNAPPSAPIVELSPTDPTTADDVEAVLTAESEDPDGDAVTYVWAWEQLDGGGVGPAAAILPSGLTARGETWRVTVTATDGDLESDPVTADATIVNAAPAVTAVAVTPEDARVTDALTCVVETTDADDDAVSVAVRWQVDGGDAGVGEVLPAGTPRGAEVVCLATPNDGFVDGAEVASAVLEIGNTPPTLRDIELLPERIQTESVVTVEASVGDPDGDLVTVSWQWFVDGELAEEAESLDGSHFARGQAIQVMGVPDDGLVEGDGSWSAVVVVDNSPPTPPSVSLPDVWFCGLGDMVCRIDGEARDADGDDFAYEVTWTVDGMAYPDSDPAWSGPTTSIHERDTVPADDLREGRWECTAVAHDHIELGEHSVPSSANVSPDLDCDGLPGDVDCDDGDPAFPRPDDPDCDDIPTHAGGGELRRVAAHTFDMGCTPGQADCHDDELPVAPVTLTQDFYVGATEVTQDEYVAVMGENPSTDVACGGSCPAEHVSWHMAAAFSNELSVAAGLELCYTCSGDGPDVVCEPTLVPGDCSGYRLLTEAEWEAAARCGEDSRFAGSDEIDGVGWYVGNSEGIQPVAGLAPNACGLYDMSGNVWEWTADWYDGLYYAEREGVDPMGPDAGTHRVDRGGSWGETADLVRLSNRSRLRPVDRTPYVGFRVGRTVGAE